VSRGAVSPYLAEPPAIYLVRPPLVVDCSVICAKLFEEETRDEALRLLIGKSLHAPQLLSHEVVSVALKKAKLGWPEATLTLALEDYAMQDIAMHPTNISEQHQIAIRYKLSAYDAAYLWLAAYIKAPLATFDEKLAVAARAHLATLN
jgi:predicted nucleic acid-binding protein